MVSVHRGQGRKETCLSQQTSSATESVPSSRNKPHLHTSVQMFKLN